MSKVRTGGHVQCIHKSDFNDQELWTTTAVKDMVIEHEKGGGNCVNRNGIRVRVRVRIFCLV